MDDVSPALARYTEASVLGDLWKRPGLSPQDRSLVTLAVLVAISQAPSSHRNWSWRSPTA